MFRRSLWRARDGTRLEHLCLVSFVILKNCICYRRETFTIADIWISVYCYHVGPSVEVLLLFGRELVLIPLRPTMEITNIPENECSLLLWTGSAAFFRMNRAAGDG